MNLPVTWAACAELLDHWAIIDVSLSLNFKAVKTTELSSPPLATSMADPLLPGRTSTWRLLTPDWWQRLLQIGSRASFDVNISVRMSHRAISPSVAVEISPTFPWSNGTGSNLRTHLLWNIDSLTTSNFLLEGSKVSHLKSNKRKRKNNYVNELLCAKELGKQIYLMAPSEQPDTSCTTELLSVLEIQHMLMYRISGSPEGGEQGWRSPLSMCEASSTHEISLSEPILIIKKIWISRVVNFGSFCFVNTSLLLIYKPWSICHAFSWARPPAEKTKLSWTQIQRTLEMWLVRVVLLSMVERSLKQLPEMEECKNFNQRVAFTAKYQETEPYPLNLHT